MSNTTDTPKDILIPEVKPFTLNVCKIPKRGKGVKEGYTEVETIGTPIVDADGITRDFDYSGLVDNNTITQILEKLESISANARQIKMGLVTGFDEIQKSQTRKDELELLGLIRYALEQGLAMHYKMAKEWAGNCQKLMAFQTKCNQLVQDIQDMTPERQKWVQSQKDKGVWVINLTPVDEQIAAGLKQDAKEAAEKAAADAAKAAKKAAKN